MWKRDPNSGALLKVVSCEEMRMRLLEERLERLEAEVRELRNLVDRLKEVYHGFKFFMKEERKDAKI